MATNSAMSTSSAASQLPAQTFQQSMQGLKTIIVARPSDAEIITLQSGQLTKVKVQAGQHYKARRAGNNANPDDVIAVRHGDDLHLRYADGSMVYYEGFYAICTNAAVCSVSLAGADATGITLSAEAASVGVVADDGMMVYAHGNSNTLMSMAAGQPSLVSAFLELDHAPVLTYLPNGTSPAILALAALGLLGASASQAATLSAGALFAGSASEGATALSVLKTAADANNASGTISLSTYTQAQVTGVNSANLAAINSALDSIAITGAMADTAAEVQTIVNAYNAILASADGTANNTTIPLTGAQYAAIGVSGVSGTSAEGNALHLLNDVVDGKSAAGVDNVSEVQALADAANHLVAAAGGTPAQIAALTLADLQALGISGVTTDNLAAVQAAIGATTPDLAVDSKNEVQSIATAAENKAANALRTISTAAEANNATSTAPVASVYADAGVTGVTASNLASISSALNSSNVNGLAADTTGEVQAIVNAYNAVLASADGNPTPNTTTPLTGAQYTAIGLSGISGVSAAGNALHLLDDVVDGKPMTSVDTVSELQALADAANHVLAASGGTLADKAALTLPDLQALGVTGVTQDNLPAVLSAIRDAASDAAVDTLAHLQAIVSHATVGSTQASSALSGVTNLEVTSDLVFSVTQTVTVGTGFIHITDLGGSTASGGTGYQTDANANHQTIDVATAVASGFLTITGTGANTKIIINPKWDLDLSSNYQLSIDDGAFLDASGTHSAVHFNTINFSTVTPGTHASGTVASEAVASQTMNDATGALIAGKSWLDIQGIGNNTANMTQLGDVSGGAYALVMKNYATTPGGALGDQTDGISTHDTNIGVQNFGNNDVVYFDSQVNNLSQQLFDGRYTLISNGANISGGLVGQNTLVMGLVSTPMQHGSTAMISLGLEGNTANTIYPAVYTLDVYTPGWANAWHNAAVPLVMG